MGRVVMIIAPALFALSITTGAQPQPPYGLAQTSVGDKVVFSWCYPAVNESTIAVFDDKPESYYFHTSADVGARLATAFELPEGIDGVASVDLFLWSSDPYPNLPGGTTSPFDLAIYADFPGDENAAPIWQIRASNGHPGQNEWLNVPVRTGIAGDSAFVEFRWLAETPVAPLPGVVYTDRFVNCYEGFRQGEALVWRQIYDFAQLMRLHVARSDLGETLPVSSALPDSFCVYVFDSPEEPGSGPGLVVAVRDSLHCSFDRSVVEGKFITVVACEGDLVSAKSEMIEVDLSTDVESESDEVLPTTLMQNFPNPFNSETTICAGNPGNVLIYDLLGRKVRELRESERGVREIWCFCWDGKSESGTVLPSGVYFYRQNGQTIVRKLILLK